VNGFAIRGTVFSIVWNKGVEMSRTILVTGATRGIGRELVKQLCEQDFAVFATGRNSQLLESLKAETGCLGATCDLADADATVALYAQARAAMGQIDVLVNNAGFNPGKDPVVDVTVDQMDASYAVNFRACFLLAREALKEMGPRQSGHIINIVSTVSKTSLVDYSAYTAMKYALKGFTQCLIKEAQRVNVKVTGVYPGGTDTDYREVDRPDYIRADSAAQMIVHCVNAPDDLTIHDITYRPMVETNF